jgi:glycosyltransferase involved in cell wall biosynthesis
MTHASQRSVSVLHVTTANQPHDIRIFHKEAIPLSRQGYVVDIAVPIAEQAYSEGIKLIPIGNPGGSRSRRIMRNLRAAWIMLRGGYDVIHVHSPELFVTAILSRFFGKHIIYDIHEFYHERIKESIWIWPPLRSAMAAIYTLLERMLLPHFAGLVVVTEEMRDQYARYESHTPVVLVRNYTYISEEARSQALCADPPITQPYIVHTGGASRLHAFDVMVAVAEQLRESGIQARIVNIGPIDLSGFSRSEQRSLLERAESAGIILTGILPYPELLRWIAHACIGYLLRMEEENAARALPTKLFEYFAFGLPVVVYRLRKTVELMRGCEAGLLVGPANVDEHFEAIRRILSDDDLASRMSAASQAQAQSYRFELELQRLLKLYAAITGMTGGIF